MALTKADKEFIAEAIAQAIGAAIVVTRPAEGKAAPVAQASEPEHIGPSGKPDGRRFPCELGCGRLLRSAGRAKVHGADGHYPPKADA
jgi:hypothetical protein